MNNNFNGASKTDSSLIPTLFFGFVLIFGLFGCSGGGSDDEAIVPTVSLAAATIAEGNAGSTVNLEFTVTSSVAIDSDITLTYATSDETATAGSDYTETSGTIDISAGSTTATISVPVLGDADFESDETFTLTLSSVTAATLGTDSVIGTIANDDDVDPKGYYSGTATVKESDGTTDLIITDLQGMVSGNRFMLLSASKVLLYDGTITDISGDSYTATVNVYKDGSLLSTSTASGSITEESSLTGKFTGTGEGNGSFSLTYSLNNADSALTRIAGDWDVGSLNNPTAATRIITISTTGEITIELNIFSSTPGLSGCDFGIPSTVEAIENVSIYNVSITLFDCNDIAVDGVYTGFISTPTVVDDIIVIAFTNGSNSGSGNGSID